MAEGPTDTNPPATTNGGNTPAGGGGAKPPAVAKAPKPKDTVLSLSQLIGAPISALVDAEAQSAMATARFIRAVGFTGNNDDMNDLGELRMATFNRTRREGNETQEVKVQIPLLTMLPIPAMQIKDAQLDYTVRIVQTEALDTSSNTELSQMRKTPDGEPLATLRASFARNPVPGDRRTMDMLVKMKVRIEQADMPDGLAKLLAVTSDSVLQDQIDAPAKTDVAKDSDDAETADDTG